MFAIEIKKDAANKVFAESRSTCFVNINIEFTMRNVFLILMIFPVFVFTQNPPTILWTEFFGEEYSNGIDCVIETSDSNLFNVWL